MKSSYDDDAESACLQKLGDILTQRPPGGRRRNDGPAEIVDHLYLGSMVDALDLDLLRRLRITHVLNCAPSAVRHYADSLRVKADDCPGSWRSTSKSPVDCSSRGWCRNQTGTNGYCQASSDVYNGVGAGTGSSSDVSCGARHRPTTYDSISELHAYGARLYDPDTSGVTSYMEIDADDIPGYPILSLHYGQARRFFDEARDAGGRALVHCELGVNRSATLAVAYLVDSERVPLTQAVRQVRIDRPNVLRNDGFRRQLVRFAAERKLLDRWIDSH